MSWIMRKDNAKNKWTCCSMFLFLALLTSSSSSWRVELSRVENMLNSTQVELKMWATWLRVESNSKCQLETRLDDQSRSYSDLDSSCINEDYHSFWKWIK